MLDYRRIKGVFELDLEDRESQLRDGRRAVSADGTARVKGLRQQEAGD